MLVSPYETTEGHMISQGSLVRIKENSGAPRFLWGERGLVAVEGCEESYVEVYDWAHWIRNSDLEEVN